MRGRESMPKSMPLFSPCRTLPQVVPVTPTSAWGTTNTSFQLTVSVLEGKFPMPVIWAMQRVKKKHNVAYLSDTSGSGLTIFCQTPNPFLLSKCQSFLLCSFPVLFSARTRETFPSKVPWRSHDIRSYKERICTEEISTGQKQRILSTQSCISCFYPFPDHVEILLDIILCNAILRTENMWSKGPNVTRQSFPILEKHLCVFLPSWSRDECPYASSIWEKYLQPVGRGIQKKVYL